MPRTKEWLRAAPLVAPGALAVYFGFNSGGYFPGAPAVVAVVLAVALALRLVTARHPLAGMSPLLLAAGGAMAAFACWALVSAGWSDAAGRALLEYDRALCYLLALIAFGSLGYTPPRLAVMLRWLAVGFFVICAAGVIVRTLPDVWTVDPGVATDRLSYPLTYWNALGGVAGLATILMLHLTASEREPRYVAVLAAAALPVTTATAFMTFSRGGIGGGIIGVLLLLAVGRPRALAGALAAAVPTCLVVLVVAYGTDALATAPSQAPDVLSSLHRVAVVIALAMLVAGALRIAGFRLDAHVARRLVARAGKPPERRRIVAAGAATAVVVIGLLLAVDAPAYVQRQYDRFLTGASTAEIPLRSRLLDAGNSGRIDNWRVAVDGFEAHPLAGTGAGTYQTLWMRDRRLDLDVVDAHSLYVEVLSELGIVGLLLLLGTILTILGGSVARARGPDRGPPAAMFAAGTAWALHAGIDWTWEMPAVTFWIFALGGMALAAPVDRPRLRDLGRVPRLVLALGLLVLAVTPASVWRSQAKLNEAVREFRAGDCAGAIDASLASLSAVGSRPEPLEIVGFCDVRLGQNQLAVQALERAQQRDPDGWEAAYGLALVRGAVGQDPRAAAQRAYALNPKGEMTRRAAEALTSTDNPRAWQRRARALPLTIR